MGIIRTVLNTAVLGGAGSVAGFAFWTRNCKSHIHPTFLQSFIYHHIASFHLSKLRKGS
jgi:hypothetical protein